MRDDRFPDALRALSPQGQDHLIASLNSEEAGAWDGDWPSWAHAGQRAPEGDWSTWVLMAGRGFGKTRAGAEWIAERIAEGGAIRIALVGATIEDARRVMIEGKSGLLDVAAEWVRDWHPSLRRVRFTTGAEATLFSGASPDMLRGPEHHFAWCDELAKWERAKECWDMLQLGLRLSGSSPGPGPRAIVTTTPRTGAVLRAIMAEPGCVTTGGATRANPHISAAYKARMEALYAGTRLGRQELEGELLPEAGALWSVEMLEAARLSSPHRHGEMGRAARRRRSAPTAASLGENSPPPAFGWSPSPSGGGFARILLAVDPPSGDGTCGIIACARSGEGRSAIAHVLADHSVTARSPEGWAQAVADAAAIHGTREVIAEANQGGKMVLAVLRQASPDLHARLVRAVHGKSVRAEPVAHLFEAGRVRLHGRFPALEAELLGLIAGGGYEGPGDSPDRADAMVWGVKEVMRGGEARVRGVD